MKAIEQYSDEELRSELERRERERLNKWHVYERRIEDGITYRISRHGELPYASALYEVRIANKGPRGQLWHHFCVPANVTLEGEDVRYV